MGVCVCCVVGGGGGSEGHRKRKKTRKRRKCERNFTAARGTGEKTATFILQTGLSV